MMGDRVLRDARGVPRYRISYTGPSTEAVRAATLIADADGIELTASKPPQRRGDAVVLELTVDGTTDDVLDAVALARGQLPQGTAIEIAEG
jgi:hypothetical protein